MILYALTLWLVRCESGQCSPDRVRDDGDRMHFLTLLALSQAEIRFTHSYLSCFTLTASRRDRFTWRIDSMGIG
jgi:hypothetical protein